LRYCRSVRQLHRANPLSLTSLRPHCVCPTSWTDATHHFLTPLFLITRSTRGRRARGSILYRRIRDPTRWTDAREIGAALEVGPRRRSTHLAKAGPDWSAFERGEIEQPKPGLPDLDPPATQAENVEGHSHLLLGQALPLGRGQGGEQLLGGRLEPTRGDRVANGPAERRHEGILHGRVDRSRLDPRFRRRQGA